MTTMSRKFSSRILVCQIRQKILAHQLTPTGKTKTQTRRFLFFYFYSHFLTAISRQRAQCFSFIFKRKKYVIGKKIRSEKWDFWGKKKKKRKVRPGHNCHSGSDQQTFGSLPWCWYLPAADALARSARRKESVGWVFHHCILQASTHLWFRNFLSWN